jgi:hypothetical protein
MVASNDTVPAIGDEDNREKLATTWLQFSFSRMSL